MWIIKNVLLKLLPPLAQTEKAPIKKPRGPREYQHHIEPKICRISRREMEELERYQQVAHPWNNLQADALKTVQMAYLVADSSNNQVQTTLLSTAYTAMNLSTYHESKPSACSFHQQ